eukprot:8839594-Pyramimonas_sp.AAC.1
MANIASSLGDDGIQVLAAPAGEGTTLEPSMIQGPQALPAQLTLIVRFRAMAGNSALGPINVGQSGRQGGLVPLGPARRVFPRQQLMKRGPIDPSAPLTKIMLLKLFLALDGAPHSTARKQGEKFRGEALHRPGPAEIINQRQRLQIKRPTDPGQEEEEGSHGLSDLAPGGLLLPDRLGIVHTGSQHSLGYGTIP